MSGAVRNGGAVRYGRRLLVVAAIIAAVIGLGVAWRASSAASLIADGQGPRSGGPQRDHGPFDRRGHDGNGGNGGLGIGNVDDFAQTVVIGVTVLGAVIVVDKLRRRRHPIRPN